MIPDDQFSGAATVIKEFREANKLSQVQLAIAADFDHSYISRLESGSRIPTRDALGRISRALHLTRKEDQRLMHAAGYLSHYESGEQRELFDLLEDKRISSEIRDAAKMLLAALLSLLRSDATTLRVKPQETFRTWHLANVENPPDWEPMR